MRRAPLALLACLLLAGCTFRGADDELTTAAGGGTVVDSPAQVRNLTLDRASVENDGAQAVILVASVFDANSETDVASLTLTLNGSSPVTVTHAVTAAERLAAAEPAAWPADGVKVWTGASSVDGTLHVRWRHVVAAGHQPGFYLAGLRATSAAGALAYGVERALNVTAASLVTVSTVDAAGATLPSSSWGAWDATPGARNATSSNFLKLVNAGSLARPRVLVDFNGLVFEGASNPAYTVPVDGNVEFAWWEDATPAQTSPSEGTYVFQPAPAGSVAISFGGAGRVVYVAYRVSTLPSPLAAQTYATTFTATELAGETDARPDLVVESLATIPAAPRHNQPIEVRVTVRNVGTGPLAADTTLTLARSGSTFATIALPAPLAVGATATLVTSGWQAARGTYAVVATADPTNAIAETVEGNNQATFTVVVT